jgi:hypothetical protein
MTRVAQKTGERRTLDSVLAASQLRADAEPEVGEAPDFIVTIDGQPIGIEVTMFQSGAFVEGSNANRRQAEAEWQKLEAAANAYRALNPDVMEINVILSFSGALPARRLHQDFINEIASFIRINRALLSENDTEFWNFPTPLMRRHLTSVYLRVCPYAIWYTSLYAGYVASPDDRIAAIVADKSQSAYRHAGELWLAIQCSTNISETMLPIGIESFAGVPPLDLYRFERIFVLTYLGVFRWKRDEGWVQLK